MFEQHQSFGQFRIGRNTSLQRIHIDANLLSVTFIYYECVHDGEKWNYEERQQVLTEGVHFQLDKRNGLLQLLDHGFWQQEGHWRAADREEPLLYKGQVKHPQRVAFSYEYYRPEEVILPREVQVEGTVKIFREVGELRMVDFEEVDQEAAQRLGYNVLKYTLALEEEI